MADAKKIALAALIFIALALQAGFCSYNQTMFISVADQNGIPVAGADVKITHQKANGITGDDGLAEGKTGEDGSYTVTIANTVPKEMEDPRIRVTAKAYDWQGETQVVQAENSNGTMAVLFTAPFELGKLTLTVLQSNGRPAAGASIYITGSEVKRIADASGKTVIYLPEGSELSGFASYESEGEYFSSSKATAGENKSRELIVRFPNVGTGPLTPGSTVLSVRFVSPDNTSLAGEKVVFSYDGADVSAYTDAGGVVSIEVESGSEVIAVVKKNDFDYSFVFNVTANGSQKNETAVLAPLLKIDYFESMSDGPGCYRLSARVSDPRLNKPIAVRMMQVKNNTSAGEIHVALDENSMYIGRVCAGLETSVKVIASNMYETAEKTIALSQAAAPEPPKPVNVSHPPTNNTTTILPKPAVEPSPMEGLGAIAVAIVILVLIFGVAALILGRANPRAAGGMAKYFTHTWGMLAGSTVRPIVEYLRSLIRKKEPPQSPFGQGPMMPQG